MTSSGSRRPGRHAILLATLAVVGGVAMAGPAIHSEIDNAGAAGLRLMVGLIVGAIGAPMFVIAVWRKPIVRAVVSVFAPPIGAAVLTRLAWSDD